MNKNILITVLIFICCKYISAQNTGDVLDNGVHVKTGRKIFLQYLNGELKYDIKQSLTDVSHPPDFTLLEDSVIFMVNKNAVNLFITPPLNPLNFSYTTDTKDIPDPINTAGTAGLISIIDVLSSVRPTPAPHGAPITKCDTLFGFLERNIKEIQNNLDSNQKDEINKAFTALKSLSFNDENKTKDSIALIRKWKVKIENHFINLKNQIDKISIAAKDYDCGTTEMAFTLKYIFTNIIKEIGDLVTDQKKRLENLQIAFDLVEKTQLDATTSSTGLKWCMIIPSIPVKEGKIYLYTFTIKQSGYRLSDKNEIVNIETKDVIKKTLRVRKFQRFVPEVSIGTAYTFFKYRNYGTTFDSAGLKTNNLFVASPTEDPVKNINITTMLNLNYYCPNSIVHPFYQLGVGINSGVPTLITGIGARSFLGLKGISISLGFALTWIKELDKLKVGDKISGTEDIDKDLKYQVTSPKFYFGIQHNF